MTYAENSDLQTQLAFVFTDSYVTLFDQPDTTTYEGVGTLPQAHSLARRFPMTIYQDCLGTAVSYSPDRLLRMRDDLQLSMQSTHDTLVDIPEPPAPAKRSGKGAGLSRSCFMYLAFTGEPIPPAPTYSFGQCFLQERPTVITSRAEIKRLAASGGFSLAYKGFERFCAPISTDEGTCCS